MEEIELYKKRIEALQSSLIEKKRILNLREKVFGRDKLLELEVRKLSSEILELTRKLIKLEKGIK